MSLNLFRVGQTLGRRAVIALVLGAVASITVGSGSALAFANIPTSYNIDENGNGYAVFLGVGAPIPLPSSLQPDTGPGGLPSVLTYDLFNPGGFVAGDLLITEPELGGGLGDVIRFNPGVLVFYSNPIDGFDSLADTPSPPSAFYTNLLTLSEDANGQIIYTPLPGQPGFSLVGPPVTYTFISDPSVPEPASLALLGAGIIGVGMMRRRKRA